MLSQGYPTSGSQATLIKLQPKDEFLYYGKKIKISVIENKNIGYFDFLQIFYYNIGGIGVWSWYFNCNAVKIL